MRVVTMIGATPELFRGEIKLLPPGHGFGGITGKGWYEGL